MQLTGKDGIPTSYLWGYNSLYPVAELRNISYASIPNTYKSNVQINSPVSDASLRTLLAGLYSTFNGQEHHLSTYTYKPLVGITSHRNPDGKIGYHEYDGIGRLVLQRDHDQKVINQYDYHMKGPSGSPVSQLWSTNAPVSRYYAFPGSFYYTKQVYNLLVPGGKYKASSMGAADLLARDEAEGLPAPPANLPGSSIKSNLAEVMIGVTTLEGSNMPSDIEIDFIKDGSIVATERIYQRSFYLTFMYMEEGTYQIVVRPTADTNYWGRFLTYGIFNMNDGIGGDFRSGDTIHIEKHKDYAIDISPHY